MVIPYYSACKHMQIYSLTYTLAHTQFKYVRQQKFDFLYVVCNLLIQGSNDNLELKPHVTICLRYCQSHKFKYKHLVLSSVNKPITASFDDATQYKSINYFVKHVYTRTTKIKKKIEKNPRPHTYMF